MILEEQFSVICSSCLTNKLKPLQSFLHTEGFTTHTVILKCRKFESLDCFLFSQRCALQLLFSSILLKIIFGPDLSISASRLRGGPSSRFWFVTSKSCFQPKPLPLPFSYPLFVSTLFRRGPSRF